jgi:hypothetical protein
MAKLKKDKAGRAIAPLGQPGPRERQAIAESTQRVHERRMPTRIAVETTAEGGIAIGAAHADEAGHTLHLLDAFGTSSVDFATMQVRWLLDRTTKGGAEPPDPAQVNALLALIDGIRPANELEATLAVQIAITNDASLRMLKKAGAAQYTEQVDSYVSAATKLQRTMVAQVEALAKLRRGGEQNVNVKHVHIHEGGQAVVGVVNQREKGRGEIGNGS